MNPRAQNRIRWRKESKDTVLVYNPNSNKLFITNSLVLKILGLCNGKNNIERIKSKMRSIDNKKILLILKELKKKNLLE